MSQPENPSVIQNHPTGVGTTIATGLIALLQGVGATNFDGTTAALIVGAVAAVLSLLSPRFS